MGYLFRNAEVEGVITDVLVEGGTIRAVAEALDPAGEIIDCEGCALIPGLHDHHIHLLATAAAECSVVTGPPQVRSADELSRALREANASLPVGVWIRGIGYHES